MSGATREVSLISLVAVAVAFQLGCASQQGNGPLTPKARRADHGRRLHKGLMQSPINISSQASAEGRHTIALKYDTSAEHIHNKGHTVKLNYDAGSGLTFDGRFYALKQIHFHTPAEHHIDGVIYPMEMHMVHTPPNHSGGYLVGAVLYKEGPESDFISGFLADIPTKAHSKRDRESKRVDLNKVFTGDGSYYHYRGSLTTPPYSETVMWCIAKTIHTASRKQILTIRALEGDNARDVQPLHGRSIDGGK